MAAFAPYDGQARTEGYRLLIFSEPKLAMPERPSGLAAACEPLWMNCLGISNLNILKAIRFKTFCPE